MLQVNLGITKLYSVKNRNSFWDLLKITFNKIIKLLLLLKINFKWPLNDHSQLNSDHS